MDLLKQSIFRIAAGILIMMAAVVIFSENARAQGFESREYDVGIEAGFWLPGTIDIEGTDIDKNGSLLFRAFVDAYMMPKFAVGGYFNYSTYTLAYDPYDIEVDADLYEFGIAFKPRFIVNPTTAVKPGLNIGYRKMSAESIGGVDTNADGLGINLSVEVQFLLDGGYIFFIDGGFLSQPAGGNNDADVTWAPILYITAGVAF